jgi:RimJ/RimL family protein N-acetyltransferase
MASMWAMSWTFTDDLGSYQAAVGGLLGAEPERNTVLLSVLASLTRLGRTAFGPAAPLLGWWTGGTGVSAAILQTPPHALLLTALPDRSAAQLARALADGRIALSGINGAEPDATALARAWLDLTGRQGQVSHRQRLHRLGELIWPDTAPEGNARIATTADTPLARSWYAAFAAEAGVSGGPDRVVDDRLRSGQLMLWEAGSEPVSLAGLTGVIAGTARIGPVYTPPRWRGRGYGAGVTAAVSDLARERGARSVVLFTDLANPTSNAIYARLGYEPVEDRVLITFGA